MPREPPVMRTWGFGIGDDGSVLKDFEAGRWREGGLRCQSCMVLFEILSVASSDTSVLSTVVGDSHSFIA